MRWGCSTPATITPRRAPASLYAKDATHFEDSRAHSLMSYFRKQHRQDFKGAYSSGPLLNDITAIQHFYGANMNTRTGDTVGGSLTQHRSRLPQAPLQRRTR